MSGNRTDRLNSLLREVISDIIRKEVKNPDVHSLVTVTKVEITRDLHYAKVFISIIGSDEEKSKTMEALRSAAGYIAVQSSKQVVIRYFPELQFKLDKGVEKHMRIENLLDDIQKERDDRDRPLSESSTGS